MDMAISNGNMRDVFLDSAKTAQAATDRYRRDGFEAEIVLGSVPRWHIVMTHPAHEKIAAGHLIGRRFGVYLPEGHKTTVVRGRLRKRRQLLYPTYLFLFVWDIAHHMRRIHGCTGVCRILMSGDVPAIVPDSLIDQIQATEFNQSEMPPDWRSAPIKKKRRRRRSREEHAPETAAELGPVTISTYSALVDMDLDPSERLGLLNTALGLPS